MAFIEYGLDPDGGSRWQIEVKLSSVLLEIAPTGEAANGPVVYLERGYTKVFTWEQSDGSRHHAAEDPEIRRRVMRELRDFGQTFLPGPNSRGM